MIRLKGEPSIKSACEAFKRSMLENRLAKCTVNAMIAAVNSYITLVLKDENGKVNYVKDLDSKDQSRFNLEELTTNKMQEIWDARTKKNLKTVLAFLIG
jgi:hypothetical protein